MRVLPCVLFIVLTEAEELSRRRQSSRRDDVLGAARRTFDELRPESSMRHFNTPEINNRARNFRPANIDQDKKVANDDKLEGDPYFFNFPVPFGHIYKEGFSDTLYGIKQPINPLEFHMRDPIDLKEKLELLEHGDPEKMHFYASKHTEETPRDKYVREKGLRAGVPNIDDLKWFDFGDFLERNFENPPVSRNQNTRVITMAPPPAQNDFGIFGNLKYGELFHPPKKDNFSTCDELATKGYFHPKDIVNLQWIPFYVWAKDPVQSSIPHTFSLVTKKFVDTYRELYKDFKDIDWERPKLMMKGKGEFLIISADRRGLFHALQVLSLPDNFYELNVTLPYTKIRIKAIDPYLVLMFCESDYAMAMAVHANIPPTDSEKITEADSLDIRGPGVPVSLNTWEEAIARQNLAKNNRLDLEMKHYIPDNPFVDPQPPNEDKPEPPQGGMGTF